jgi:hypothetical protein
MIEKIMQKYETILFDNKKRKIFFVVVFILPKSAVKLRPSGR